MLVIATLLGADRIALAQAGSVGGTIGKTDKSISGGVNVEGHASPKREAAPKRSVNTKIGNKNATHGGCQRIIGTWTWFFGTTTVFSSGGSASNSSGLTSTWRCAGGVVVALWSHGITDRITISSDGNRLSVSSSNGITWAGARK
jgi:hypothetical protein